jgi:hypothetical protein
LREAAQRRIFQAGEGSASAQCLASSAINESEGQRFVRLWRYARYPFCPAGSGLKLTFLEWALDAQNNKAFRRRQEVPAVLFHTPGDSRGGVAKAKDPVPYRHGPGIERSYVDTWRQKPLSSSGK